MACSAWLCRLSFRVTNKAEHGGPHQHTWTTPMACMSSLLRADRLQVMLMQIAESYLVHRLYPGVRPWLADLLTPRADAELHGAIGRLQHHTQARAQSGVLIGGVRSSRRERKAQSARLS